MAADDPTKLAGAAAGNESPAPTSAVSSPARPAGVSHRSIARAAFLLMLGNALSRVLGLVREQVIAALFGQTAATSAFTTAATVPTIVYDLLVGGAITAALVPVFTDYRSERAELGRIVGTIGFLLVVLLATTAAALAVAAPVVVAVLGATTDPVVFNQTVAMVRWLLPAVVFLGFSGLSSALLYARQQFTMPAFAVAGYNLGIIVAALTLAPLLDLQSLVIGVLVGAFVQCTVQWPALRDVWTQLRVDLRHPGVRRILGLYAPVAGGLVITAVGIVIDRNLAWRTGDDSIALMRFATTLVQLPLGLIATATSFAILPTLARLAGPEDDAYKRTLALGLRMIVLLTVPAAFGLITLREPIVGLLFERGAFDAAATSMTAQAFLLYAPQIPFVAVDQLLIVAFYARKNTLTPMLVGLGGVGVYLTVALALIGPASLGVWGLILANTTQHILHALVLYVLLRRAIGNLEDRALIGALGRAAAATVLGLAAMIGLAALIATPATTIERLVYVVVVGGAFAAVYAVALAVLRTDELRPLVQRLRG